MNNEMINFYENRGVKQNLIQYENPNYNLTQMKHPFYAGLIGCSGCGKTNSLINLIYLMSKGKGTWSHIHVVHKMEENLYEFMKEKIGDGITFYKNISDLPSPEKIDVKGQSLIIFDDQIAEGRRTQQIIMDWFIRSRKLGKVGFSCIILSQSYYPIPIVIRQQFHYLLVFKVRQTRDIKAILKDAGKAGMDQNDLMDMYKDATNAQFNFLKIDLNAKDINKTFSKNFTDFYQLK